MKKYIVERPFKSKGMQYTQGEIVTEWIATSDSVVTDLLVNNGFIKEIEIVNSIDNWAVDISNRPDWELRLDEFLLKNDRWLWCVSTKDEPPGYASDCSCCFGTELKNCNCECHARIEKLKKFIQEEISEFEEDAYKYRNLE